MASLTLRGVAKHFGSVKALSGIDLEIAHREFVVIVGPSGCGKSTLLRIIAGLEQLTSGEIYVGDQAVHRVPAANRGLAMVFQNYALYPHMTVAQNMGFALKMAKVRRDETDRRVNQAARILQIENLLDRKPRQLSGGQRQRVAIGRAIVREPKVFLFDEPLSNLDAALRVDMRIELAKLHSSIDATMIYVTHDQVEAMTMADKIVVLREGRIEQVGAPMDLYLSPANVFVAGFIGSPRMNQLPATVSHVSQQGVSIKASGGLELTLPVAPGDTRPGESVILGVRPEHLALSADPGDATLSADVYLTEPLGGETILYGQVDDGKTLVVKLIGLSNTHTRGHVQVKIDPALCHLFREDGVVFPPQTSVSGGAQPRAEVVGAGSS